MGTHFTRMWCAKSMDLSGNMPYAGVCERAHASTSIAVPCRFTNTSIVHFLYRSSVIHKISVYNKYTIQLSGAGSPCVCDNKCVIATVWYLLNYLRRVVFTLQFLSAALNMNYTICYIAKSMRFGSTCSVHIMFVCFDIVFWIATPTWVHAHVNRALGRTKCGKRGQ